MNGGSISAVDTLDELTAALTIRRPCIRRHRNRLYGFTNTGIYGACWSLRANSSADEARSSYQLLLSQCWCFHKAEALRWQDSKPQIGIYLSAEIKFIHRNRVCAMCTETMQF
jgi:hypothetical protein